MRTRCALLACVSVAAAACGGSDSHAQMVALLDEFAAKAEVHNEFFGSRKLQTLRADFARLGDRAPWELRWQLGTTELEQGHERAAIGVLEATRAALLAGTLPGDDAAKIGVTFHLGVAYLRLGETQNCCANPTHETCILPIQGSGQHERLEGSERATECFLEVLRNTEATDYWHYAAMWL